MQLQRRDWTRGLRHRSLAWFKPGAIAEAAPVTSRNVVNEESSDEHAARDDPGAAAAAELIPDTLWHYTDASGLLGILGGGAAATSPTGATFWATGLEYLNDHQELVFGLKHVRAAIESFTEEFRSVIYAPHERHIYVNIPGKVAFLERLGEAITAVIERTYPYPIHCYVTSFSTEDDLLSQWRGYGSGLDGYAIAVDPLSMAMRKSPLVARSRSPLVAR